MNPPARSNPLAAYLTHADIAKCYGVSYFTAYSLGVAGALGEPILVGRTKLFPRDVAEGAIARHLAERAPSFNRYGIGSHNADTQ